ncbi:MULTISPECIES: T6SS immunity protein Tli4 family protein [unclassified Pseudomonas]|uniref:T6SS immunity protein Tli4 family protein n=1 Tax=unclassified Pseudomonas TaxID=196821 RepID=UPI0002A41ACC|nr:MULTISPECIES: T6SS immunity protein Tli4 family protein [unclassified Pseudomonas]NTX90445.1 hypothetical protein [Pseudomonas sp. UMA643]NTY19850.1 hypothetical protein [Pseudomonas sp. UMC3103]NTY26623.1 hypothetical protein [Pseudomonas sp. UMA603]NTY33153.1 hypothetical protein [Pseudomonas sp. UMC3129]NTY55268.1 hypothetical protein [Pseudomonas sp. UMC631]
MTVLTQNMRTHCVGRLLIDLPEGSAWEPNASGATIGNIKLSVVTDTSLEQFQDLVEQRWKEVRETKKDDYGNPYRSPSESFGNLERGFVFAYQHETVDGLADDDETVIKRIFHTAEGYYWDAGTLFKLGPVLNGKQGITDLLPRLHARKPDETPLQPGLCLNGAFVSGYYDFNESEQVSWSFSLPRNIGITIRHTKVSAPATSLFQRELESRGEAEAYIAAFLKPGDTFEEHLFRKAIRQVGELPGEELVAGSVENTGVDKYETFIGATWGYPGQGSPSLLPKIELSSGTPRFLTTYIPSPAGGFPRPEDTPDGPTEAEFFEVWDAVVGNIRFRPDALISSPPPPPSAPLPISRKQAEEDQRALDDFIASHPNQPKP